MADDAQEPPRAQGQALDWTDAEIRAMAQVTPERIEQARTAWKRAIGGYFHDLIDAQRGRPS